MKIAKRQQHLGTSQLGIISIIVTMIMMVVISLIVITYSQIIRREQRQALDQQLSSQAFYAAESAANIINDAVSKGIVSDASIIKTSNSACNGNSSTINKLSALPGGAVYAAQIPTTGNIAVTCLQVRPDANTLAFDSLAVDVPQVVHIQASGGGNISDLQFSWQLPSTSIAAPAFPASVSFPALSGWGAGWPSVLRLDLVPPPAQLNPTNLYNAEHAFFLYPLDVSAGGSGTAALGTSGSIVNAVCSNAGTPKYCKATISGLSGSDFYLRIRPIYAGADLVVTPLNGGASVTLLNGQIVIDATARSADVLKRISIRRPVNPNYTTPGFVIDSAAGICKRLSTAPGGALGPGTSDPDCGGIN